jgi:hypothetical protein
MFVTAGSRAGRKRIDAQAFLRHAACCSALNIGLAVSASSGALTIAIKAADSSDPTPINKVSVTLQSTAAGRPQVRAASSALSLTVPSGATLGASSASPNRIWVLAVDDGVNWSPAIMNCSTATNIFALDARGAITTAAIDTASDSAGQAYSSSVLSNKSYVVVGIIEYDNLTTAGTWTVPDRVKLFGPGIHLPSAIVRQWFVTSSGSSTTNTTFTDVSGATLTITPTCAQNRIVIAASFGAQITAGGAGTNSAYQFQLLRSATILKTGVVETASGAGTNQQSTSYVGIAGYLDTPATAASVTYTLQQKKTGGTSQATTTDFSMLLQEVAG